MDIWIKGGVLYDQHYAWQMRFNADSKMVGVRVFFDSHSSKDVLAAEIERQWRNEVRKQEEVFD